MQWGRRHPRDRELLRHDTARRTAPLHAFTVESPQTVQYLIPVRAAGDFLVWLQANPNSAGAKLENIVI